MAIALIASNQSLATRVAALLCQEDLQVILISLDAGFGAASVPGGANQGILLQSEQGVETIAEQVIRARQALGPQLPLLVCCPQPGHTDRKTLFECGANEVITPASWAAAPVTERILAEIIHESIQTNRCGDLRGGTRVMREVYHHIETLAPLDEPILIHGETGTGKELVARELHKQSARQDVFLPINCAELSPELLNSEMFGHEKGAFTTAFQQRKGLLVAAQSGTAFLDEIGELDMQAQAKLLRVIEDRQVRPVGSNRWEKVRARIVMASNRNLEEESQLGKFRPDLLERIRGFTLELPALRNRKPDIVLLARHFVDEYSSHYQKTLHIPSGALDCLFRYDWIGNVRELRAAVRKAAAYADDRGNISALVLQEAARGRKKPLEQPFVSFDPSSETWREVQKRVQTVYFRSVLSTAGGNKEIAAKLSGLSRAHLYEKLKEID
jgi:DNA-binding NtrC family response regulator